MKRFLYYFAAIPGVNDKMLSDRGCLDRFTDRPGGRGIYSVMPVDSGPAGGGCVVFSGEARPDLSAVRWIEGEKFWAGVEVFTPGPDDLIREVGIAGYDAVLADGLVWRVPLIRRWDREQLRHLPAVPTAIVPVREKQGYRYETQVRPEYAAVDELAGWVIEAYVSRQPTVPVGEIFEKAARLLALNYRIGVEEAGLIGLLDEQTAVRVLQLAADIPEMVEQARELAGQGLLQTPRVEEDKE